MTKVISELKLEVGARKFPPLFTLNFSSLFSALDKAGNRKQVEEEPSGRVVDYDYDATNRLERENITEPGKETRVIEYDYDKVGNRKTKTECTDAGPCVSTTYVYDKNNRLRKEDDISYDYDDNGNLIAKQSAEEQIVYQYDYDNHLIRVETTRYGATIVVEYEYDADGNRVRKTIDGNVVINYLVDTNRDYAQVVEERDGDGNLLVRYVYGHDLISQTRPSTGSGSVISYYHYDGLGSTRALSSSAGIVTDSYSYDAFGLLLEQTGTTENAYRYRGEQFDEELGFYYLRARYMDPNVGRFVTMDEFAGLSQDPVTLHKYLYANANPVTYSDPSGNFSVVEVQMTTSIRGILSGIQTDIGFSMFDQVAEGGYSGLKGLVVGGVLTLSSPLIGVIAENSVEMLGDAIVKLRASVGETLGKLFRKFSNRAAGALKQAESLRSSPGKIIGKGKNVARKWLRGSHGNAGQFPKQIADKLQNIEFRSFDHFREEFWKAVASDKELASGFKPSNIKRMQEGLAPIAHSSQHLGEQRSYILHHAVPIQHGGGVYDVDNLMIVTPRYHKEVLLSSYHY